MNSNQSEPTKLSKLKHALQVIAGLLTILKLIPIPGWRSALVAISAMISVVIGVLEKCDSNQQSDLPPRSEVTKTPTPEPSKTPTRTPSPTPTPIEIIVPEKIVAKEPFIVRVTAPFDYNTNLNVDRFHLCILGQEYKTKLMSCTVTLWTPGKRVLRVTLASGKTIEKWVDVHEPAHPRLRSEFARSRNLPSKTAQ